MLPLPEHLVPVVLVCPFWLILALFCSYAFIILLVYLLRQLYDFMSNSITETRVLFSTEEIIHVQSKSYLIENNEQCCSGPMNIVGLFIFPGGNWHSAYVCSEAKGSAGALF